MSEVTQVVPNGSGFILRLCLSWDPSSIFYFGSESVLLPSVQISFSAVSSHLLPEDETKENFHLLRRQKPCVNEEGGKFCLGVGLQNRSAKEQLNAYQRAYERGQFQGLGAWELASSKCFWSHITMSQQWPALAAVLLTKDKWPSIDF